MIGVGVKASTSALLPPACDEFLFYENLEGVEPQRAEEGARPEPEEIADTGTAELESLITTTLAGLQRSVGGEVLASSLKRALLRKDSTFSEADYGFRAFGELLRHLEAQGVIELSEGPGRGDPVVQFPSTGTSEQAAFELLADVVDKLAGKNGPVVLSGLKNQLRKEDPDVLREEVRVRRDFSSSARPQPPKESSSSPGTTPSATIESRLNDPHRRGGGRRGGDHRLVDRLSTRPSRGREGGRTGQRQRPVRGLDRSLLVHRQMPVHPPRGGAPRLSRPGVVRELVGVHRALRNPLRACTRLVSSG